MNLGIFIATIVYLLGGLIAESGIFYEKDPNIPLILGIILMILGGFITIFLLFLML